MMEIKEEAIGEFREFCLSLRSRGKNTGGAWGRFDGIISFNDNGVLINETAKQIITKYNLSREDAWGDFRTIIREVFELPEQST